MKLLAISDIHTDIENLKEIVEHIKTRDIVLDIIIIAGDISSNTLRISESKNLPIVKSIAKLLLPLAPTYFVLGNDDDPSLEKLMERNGIVSLENKIVNIGNWTFVGWGGTVDKTVLKKYNGEVSIKRVDGINTWSDDSVYKKLKPTIEKIKSDQYLCMVTHYHPDRVFFVRRTDKFSQVGSKGLKEILNQFKPDLWLCAHIHNQTGKQFTHDQTQTIFIRVTSVVTGYNENKKKNFGKSYWIIDLDDKGKIKTNFFELVDQESII